MVYGPPTDLPITRRRSAFDKAEPMTELEALAEEAFFLRPAADLGLSEVDTPRTSPNDACAGNP